MIGGHLVHAEFGDLVAEVRNAVDGGDQAGKLQWQGPILARGLLDVKRVPFDEGFSAPIPADPTDYLEFDYGPDWLPEPPLSRRVAPHHFARIDLGEFLLENRDAARWRSVDLRGELFEKD